MDERNATKYHSKAMSIISVTFAKLSI